MAAKKPPSKGRISKLAANPGTRAALADKYSNDAWFAGFAAGEGCFQLVRRLRENGRTTHLPAFIIGLRADDAVVLEELAAVFGGRITIAKARGGSAPCCYWQVRAKADLVKLVAYFDAHSLRAKKAGDYTLWRQAVSIYLTHGGTDERLATLKAAIADGRTYDTADEPDLIAPYEVQIGLGIA
jgi:hypothetical protein